MTHKSNPVALTRVFNLRLGQAEPQAIDATIRDGMRIGGTNLWVLMFAILIASIGLNVNSTAVIIGAMLISPLMGPIIGAGYGTGIHDTRLVRHSLRNLAVFAGISLLTSTLYFLVSPLSSAQSELLARTTPTIWDVAIAFFGGAAGMVGLTRKEKTTVIPGVAIATALMPPLCTAGYGLARGDAHFVLGALYLFAINSVFIAFATLAVTRALRLPMHAFPDEGARLRGRAVIAAAITLTLVPSVYLAAQMVRDEVFTTQARRYVAALDASHPDLVILTREIDAASRAIHVSVIGGVVTPELRRSLESRLAAFDLAGARLEVRRPAEQRPEIDVAGLKRELQQEVNRAALRSLEAQAARAAAIEEKTALAARFEQQISRRRAQDEEQARLAEEIRAQVPRIHRATVALAPATDAEARKLVVVLESNGALPASEIQRLRRWLGVRVPKSDVELVIGKRAA
jgi:uncharacterized hydrophobic protein (TIGR00271 family)